MSPLAPPQLFFLTSSQIPLPLIQTGDPPLTSSWDRRLKGGLKPPQNTNNSPGAPGARWSPGKRACSMLGTAGSVSLSPEGWGKSPSALAISHSLLLSSVSPQVLQRSDTYIFFRKKFP